MNSMEDGNGYISVSNNYAFSDVYEPKEKVNMNLVVFVRCSDGLLLISDSKSRLPRYWCQETDKENIDKFFYTDKFVVGNYGRNGIFNFSVEEIITNIIKENPSENLHSILRKIQEAIVRIEKKETLKLIGYDIQNDIFHKISINKDKIEITNDTSSFISGGNNYYTDAFQDLLITQNVYAYDLNRLYCTRDFIIENIIPKLEEVIKGLDKIPVNNPCGLPVKYHKL